VKEYYDSILKDGWGISKKDLFYLEGALSGYEESHGHVHNMSVAGVAAGMSKYERVGELGERRCKVYRRIFKHMTGYDDYESAKKDQRMMTPSGIVPVERSQYDDLPDDFDEEFGVEEVVAVNNP
jgi:hypothetical protein